MRLLLDTHVLLWAVSRSSRLSDPARAAIASPSNALLFSVASFWEISIKVSLGKLELGGDWRTRLPREIARFGVSWLQLDVRHAGGVAELPWHHRDPFDRILVAQAQAENLTIVTKDAEIREYDVAVIW